MVHVGNPSTHKNHSNVIAGVLVANYKHSNTLFQQPCKRRPKERLDEVGSGEGRVVAGCPETMGRSLREASGAAEEKPTLGIQFHQQAGAKTALQITKGHGQPLRLHRGGHTAAKRDWL